AALGAGLPYCLTIDIWPCQADLPAGILVHWLHLQADVVDTAVADLQRADGQMHPQEWQGCIAVVVVVFVLVGPQLTQSGEPAPERERRDLATQPYTIGGRWLYRRCLPQQDDGALQLVVIECQIQVCMGTIIHTQMLVLIKLELERPAVLGRLV